MGLAKASRLISKSMNVATVSRFHQKLTGSGFHNISWDPERRDLQISQNFWQSRISDFIYFQKIRMSTRSWKSGTLGKPDFEHFHEITKLTHLGINAASVSAMLWCKTNVARLQAEPKVQSSSYCGQWMPNPTQVHLACTLLYHDLEGEGFSQLRSQALWKPPAKVTGYCRGRVGSPKMQVLFEIR